MARTHSPTKTFSRTGQGELDDALARVETVLHEIWQAGCALEDAPRDTLDVERALADVEDRVSVIGARIIDLR
jgi:hypothetical protein